MGQCASQRDGGNSKKETESSLGSKRIGSSSNGSGNPDTHSTKDIDIVYSLPGLGTYNDKNEDINLVKWDIVLPNSAFKEPEMFVIVKDAKFEGIFGIARAISKFSDHTMVLSQLCLASGEIIVDETSTQTNEELHVLADSLICMLEGHQDEYLVSNVCWTISQLAKSSSGRAALVSHDAISVLIQVIEAHDETREVVWWAINGLYFLLRDESGKRVRANILSAKKLGAEKVIDARRRHFVGDIGMQAQLSEVVRALDWDPAN